MTDRFENMLQAQARTPADQDLLGAIAFVGDALFMAWLYWDAKHPDMKPTPADLIATTRLFQERAHWVAERDERRAAAQDDGL